MVDAKTDATALVGAAFQAILAEHLADWRAADRGEQGQIRTPAEAEVSEPGRAEWGALNQGRCCDEENCQR